jgi:polyhydroxybutyrate depolymerase
MFSSRGARRIVPAALGVLAVVATIAYVRLGRFVPLDAASLTGAATRGVLRVGELDRTYVDYAPAALPPHPALVVALHGAGETGELFREHTAHFFDRLADAHGFVVAYPDAYERRWNDCRRNISFPAHDLRIDDVGFFRTLVAEFETKLGVDPARVFVLGHSSGGQMALRIAVEAGDVVGGAAAISASLPVDDNNACAAPSRPVAVLVIDGTADPLNPYAGGKKSVYGFGNLGVARSAFDTVRYFVALDGLPATPATERVPGGTELLWVERSTWAQRGAPEVVLDTVHGGGHTIPQPHLRYPAILGPTDTAFDGPEEIWRFFQRQTRVAP